MNLKSVFDSEFKNPEIPKKIFRASAIIALFLLSFRAPLDPDLFWHLKTGELMWQYKIIPGVDWYSFTMSDFPWIDHEWLTEILMYLIKNSFGWEGLATFFATTATFIFLGLVPKISRSLETKKYPFYACFIISSLGAITSSLIFGERPQVLSLLGVALILYVIRECQINDKSKIIYFLPILFLLWANMHASFILGLALLGAYLALDRSLSLPASRHPDAEWLKLYRPLSPETWKKLSQLSILSIIATLINPYGARLYIEIFRTFSDNYGRDIIIEWLSPNFHSESGKIFGFYLILLFIIVTIAKKVDLFSFVLIPFLLYFSLQASRNIPFFVLISLPVLIKNLEGFEEIFASVMQKKFIAISLSIMFILIPLKISDLGEVYRVMHDQNKLAEHGGFPSKEATDFLKNYRLNSQKNVLNDYVWGGYLINDLKCSPYAKPEKNKQPLNAKNKEMQCEPKVFIDGRMAHWITDDRPILKDYINITNLSDDTKEILEKYKIGVIFTNKTLLLSRSLRTNNEWKKIYEDDLSVIYEKIN